MSIGPSGGTENGGAEFSELEDVWDLEDLETTTSLNKFSDDGNELGIGISGVWADEI